MDMNKALRRTSVAVVALFVLLMINLNYWQGSQAGALQKNPENSRQFQGIFRIDRGQITAGGQVLADSYKIGGKRGKDYGRQYPANPDAFWPITGVFMPSGQTFGVESAFNSLLLGRDKQYNVQSWFDEFVGKKPGGANVNTTIDPKAQQQAFKILQNGTDRRAAAVFVDVKTGAIKVMASTPSIDANTVAAGKNSKAAVDTFSADARRPFNPTLNQAMNQTYPAGSTFKIIMSALEIDRLGLNENSQVPTPQTLILPSGHQLPNDPGSTCDQGNTATLINAFAWSCNSTYGKLAMEAKSPAINTQATKFGFNSPINIGGDSNKLDSAASTIAAGGDPNKITGDDLARTGIGQQDMAVTPLQMAMVAEAVANNGTEMQPYLVQSVTTSTQHTLLSASPNVLGHPISSGTASQLQDMMRAVVGPQGTGSALAKYDIAGKTGTAETGLQNNSVNDRWFVGFGPAHNPKYAFAVMTEGPGFGATFGGVEAGQILQALQADGG
jgi:peptidoglycan glycosyltransferase